MQLRDYIHRSETSVSSLAAIAEVDAHVVHKIINDGHRPKVTTAQRISSATGGLVSPQELLGLELCRCQALDLALREVQHPGLRLSGEVTI